MTVPECRVMSIEGEGEYTSSDPLAVYGDYIYDSGIEYGINDTPLDRIVMIESEEC